MKKNRLLADYEYNFELLGIASQEKDYKLAWTLNRLLHIHLIKGKDFALEYTPAGNILIANFIFETEHCKLRLLKNKAVEEAKPKVGYLLPELQQFDYFFMVHDPAGTFPLQEIKKKIREADAVQFLTSVDINTLKSKENLII